MKKQYMYSIIAVLVLTITTIGSTYAFFASSASSNNALSTNSKKFEVIYTGGSEINGPLKIGTRKEDGINTAVNIKVAAGSVLAKSTLYINVERITANLANDAFVWEVIGIKNGNQVYYNRGDFQGVNDTNNNVVNIVENYQLSEDDTTFTAYLWIDAIKADNSILNSEFSGYIGAKSENFTGVTG